MSRPLQLINDNFKCTDSPEHTHSTDVNKVKTTSLAGYDREESFCACAISADPFGILMKC